MTITVRQGTAADVEACGAIIYEAFKSIADQHNMVPDIPEPQVGSGLLSMLVSSPKAHLLVAEIDGRLVGSAGMDERSAIVGVGPVTVDPNEQNSGVGRELMNAVFARAQQTGAPGLRLMQDSYHTRSLVLYTKVGFIVREPVAVMQGEPVNVKIPGCTVRAGTDADVDACNVLCASTHGVHRGGEVQDAAGQGRLLVVERSGRITGYTTTVGFFGHSIGESNDDLKALIGGVKEYPGPGFHVPSQNTALLQWCLDNGLRMNKAMTLMTIGLYNEPKGSYMPSINY